MKKNKKPIHKKILSTLLYGTTYQELGDIMGHTKQSITPLMKRISQKDKEAMQLKRMNKIKKIME